jgi:hypothetical protein
MTPPTTRAATRADSTAILDEATPTTLTGEAVDLFLQKLWETERSGIYKAPGSDRWFCNVCSLNGDKWFMRAHGCSSGSNNKNKMSRLNWPLL